jgi:hypothetical protein
MNLIINAAESIEDGHGIVLLRTGLETIYATARRGTILSTAVPSTPAPTSFSKSPTLAVA